MFQSFQKHKRILVTGPMRSGTTICATMIGRDTGKTIVREESIFSVWPLDMNMVVQAPVLLPEAKRLALGGWFVVVMIRSMDEVLPSTQKYLQGKMALDAIKTHVFKSIAQANVLAEWLEEEGLGQQVIYDNLRMHSMWVEERSSFGPRDISTAIPDRNVRSSGEAYLYP